MDWTRRLRKPIHLQRLLIRMVAIGSVPHRSKRSLFEIILPPAWYKVASFQVYDVID